MVELVPATKNSIREDYELFQVGMASLIKKARAKFVPADIYHQLMQGRVHLYWVENGGDRLGFAVVSQHDAGYEEIPTLMVDHVWLRQGATVFTEAVAAIRELANEIGVERIEFNSSRLGWAKRAKEIGCTPVFVTYQCQVNNNV